MPGQRVNHAPPAPKVAAKWRPRMRSIVTLVVMTALALPLAGLFFFRIYENQLIRQTEAELIGQAAVLAAVMAREIEAVVPTGVPLGAPIANAPADPDMPYAPMLPTLDLTRDQVLGPRPAAQPPHSPADAAFVRLGEQLTPLLADTQRITLAGFRLLDPRGVIIAGRDELGQSLAQVGEVISALNGEFRAVMRERVSKHNSPPLYSLSRGTDIRLFVAMPVVARGHVAGVVYASRTPSNIFKSFYEERGKVIAAGIIILALAATIGFIFQRTITHPISELMKRARSIGEGDRVAGLSPLAHYGTVELADLSQGFFDTAYALQSRSDFIATFAAHVSHELKSPLTAIQGAAELMRDDLDASTSSMSAEDQRRFLSNIISDTARLTLLVQRLRDLARAENSPTSGETSLKVAIGDLRTGFTTLDFKLAGDADERIRISSDNARIVFEHLADNAARHGAKVLSIICRRADGMLWVTVQDDGAGISSANREKIFTNFFTTRRDSGGTGMGLPIVRAMLESHGGGIKLADDEGESVSARFTLSIPLSLPEDGRP